MGNVIASEEKDRRTREHDGYQMQTQARRRKEQAQFLIQKETGSDNVGLAVCCRDKKIKRSDPTARS